MSTTNGTEGITERCPAAGGLWPAVGAFLLFLLSNIFTHAATIKIPPGAHANSTLPVVFTALFAPIVAGDHAFVALARWAHRFRRGQITLSNACGGYTVEDANTATGVAVLVPLRFLPLLDRRKVVSNNQYTLIGGLLHFGKSQLQLRDAERRDSFQRQKRYYPVYLPPTTVFERENYGHYRIYPSSSALSQVFAVIQISFSSYQLYRNYRGSILTNGLSSPYIFIVPYIVMSLINLLANVLVGTYSHITILPMAKDTLPDVNEVLVLKDQRKDITRDQRWFLKVLGLRRVDQNFNGRQVTATDMPETSLQPTGSESERTGPRMSLDRKTDLGSATGDRGSNSSSVHPADPDLPQAWEIDDSDRLIEPDLDPGNLDNSAIGVEGSEAESSLTSTRTQGFPQNRYIVEGTCLIHILNSLVEFDGKNWIATPYYSDGKINGILPQFLQEEVNLLRVQVINFGLFWLCREERWRSVCFEVRWVVVFGRRPRKEAFLVADTAEPSIQTRQPSTFFIKQQWGGNPAFGTGWSIFRQDISTPSAASELQQFRKWWKENYPGIEFRIVEQARLREKYSGFLNILYLVIVSTIILGVITRFRVGNVAQSIFLLMWIYLPMVRVVVLLRSFAGGLGFDTGVYMSARRLLIAFSVYIFVTAIIFIASGGVTVALVGLWNAFCGDTVISSVGTYIQVYFLSLLSVTVLYAVALGILSVIGIPEFVHRVDDLETRSLTSTLKNQDLRAG